MGGLLAEGAGGVLKLDAAADAVGPRLECPAQMSHVQRLIRCRVERLAGPFRTQELGEIRDLATLLLGKLRSSSGDTVFHAVLG